MIHGTTGQALMLSVKITGGEINLFPQMKIYDTADALTTTLNYTHVAEGLYKVAWTPLVTGYYHGSLTVYTDAPHTIESTTYAESGCLLKIDEMETDVDDILTDTGTTLDGKLNTLQTDMTFLKDIEGGRWHRTGNQLILYKSDNLTVVATFDLLKSDGTPAGETDDVYERSRA